MTREVGKATLQSQIAFGSESPEGNLYAVCGKLYIQTSAGSLWQKTTRAELNTGWVEIDGTTILTGLALVPEQSFGNPDNVYIPAARAAGAFGSNLWLKNGTWAAFATVASPPPMVRSNQDLRNVTVSAYVASFGAPVSPSIAVVLDTQRLWFFDPESSDTEDGSTVVKPVNLEDADSGRWIRLYLPGTPGGIDPIGAAGVGGGGIPGFKPAFRFAVDANLEVQFTYYGDAADSWDWDFGDGDTSTDENPFHQYAASGDYTVTLTATSGALNGSVTKTVSVVSVCDPHWDNPANVRSLESTDALAIFEALELGLPPDVGFNPLSIGSVLYPYPGNGVLIWGSGMASSFGGPINVAHGSLTEGGAAELSISFVYFHGAVELPKPPDWFYDTFFHITPDYQTGWFRYRRVGDDLECPVGNYELVEVYTPFITPPTVPTQIEVTAIP